ncbi:uncharacterized protein LY89DRAFT_378810 [Mollisia scopiformis]|uniref:Uncharacterized protein n=1 Tax=Mollisia scopiformis TaxID=149040 RepID=A0A194XN87_MOLSC|nr:uncharacterized protein LY89DRAFT_378810 [Mollisia scopiformis]KUJ21606.1 hypothetical protein LY89DRAFT_378810 [Mollisia scopiformis]
MCDTEFCFPQILSSPLLICPILSSFLSSLLLLMNITPIPFWIRTYLQRHLPSLSPTPTLLHYLSRSPIQFPSTILHFLKLKNKKSEDDSINRAQPLIDTSV